MPSHKMDPNEPTKFKDDMLHHGGRKKYGYTVSLRQELILLRHPARPLVEIVINDKPVQGPVDTSPY